MRFCECGAVLSFKQQHCADCSAALRNLRRHSGDESLRPTTLLQCLNLDLICECGATYKRRMFWMRNEALKCGCGRALRWRCPFVGCRHHVYGEVKAGRYRAYRDPDFEKGPLEFKETCVLDMLWRDYTLEEIGNVFVITRERIRQIENKAQRVLKSKLKWRDIEPEPLRDAPDIFVIPAGHAWSFRDVRIQKEERGGQQDDHVRAWRVATIKPAQESKPKPALTEKWIFDPWKRRK